ALLKILPPTTIYDVSSGRPPPRYATGPLSAI
ncbi:hypothetical protein A2U01_0119004, partial [Trifolium medium]|nr:hypothetical protein [Trifolium medium]